MRRILLAFLLMLAWAVPASAQWSLVQTRTACPAGCDVTDDWTNATGVGGQIIVTGLTTTTAGNTLIIYATSDSDTRTVSSATCNGDTVTALHTEYSSRSAYLGGVVVATTGTSCTVTLNGASLGAGASVVVEEWSGGAASLTESGTSTGSINTGVTAHAAATVTPSNAPVLYVSVLILSGSSGGMTHDADFTGATTGSGTVMYRAYRTQADTTAQGITFTTTNSRSSNVSLAALEGASSGGGCSGGLLLLGAGKCE